MAREQGSEALRANSVGCCDEAQVLTWITSHWSKDVRSQAQKVISICQIQGGKEESRLDSTPEAPEDATSSHTSHKLAGSGRGCIILLQMEDQEAYRMFLGTG